MNNFKKFAVVTVNLERKIEEDDLQQIENKLRQFKEINSFSPNSTKLSFYIWSEDEINYQVVDELKELLKDKHKEAKFTAVEFGVAGTKEF